MRGNLLFDLPQVSARGSSTGSRNSSRRRPQPVRDTLMAFLTKPHTVKEIAIAANRSSSNVTGHLRAMRRKNLVVRLSWGVWVRRDAGGNAPDHASIRRNNPAQERLLELLHQPRRLGELAEITGVRSDTVSRHIQKMMKLGQIEQRPGHVFEAIRG